MVIANCLFFACKSLTVNNSGQNAVRWDTIIRSMSHVLVLIWFYPEVFTVA
jgi:hypothetical protein